MGVSEGYKIFPSSVEYYVLSLITPEVEADDNT